MAEIDITCITDTHSKYLDTTSGQIRPNPGKGKNW
jgi:hypothetical protein